MTRQDAEGQPAGGWYPAQRLTLDEAIAAFTRGAAYAEFAEATRGVIAVGRAADLTVFDRALAAGSLAARDRRSAYTIVDGEIVFDARPRRDALSMRFCPFCSAENADELAVCAAVRPAVAAAAAAPRAQRAADRRQPAAAAGERDPAAAGAERAATDRDHDPAAAARGRHHDRAARAAADHAVADHATAGGRAPERAVGPPPDPAGRDGLARCDDGPAGEPRRAPGVAAAASIARASPRCRHRRTTRSAARCSRR